MNQLPNIAAMLRAQQVQALLLTNDAPESIQYATGFGGLEAWCSSPPPARALC